MSAYAASAGIQSRVFMPKDVLICFQVECKELGAKVTLVDGLINDCGAKAKEGVNQYGWFDLSTLNELYRLERKKTAGYELAEQMNWNLPDVIMYPTGGGTGLVGMWKTFSELEEMGLIGSKWPRMVSIQTQGCVPIIRAFEEGVNTNLWEGANSNLWEGAKTLADGMQVPVAVGDFFILEALRESRGTAIAVSDQEMMDYTRIIGRQTGIISSTRGSGVSRCSNQITRGRLD